MDTPMSRTTTNTSLHVIDAPVYEVVRIRQEDLLSDTVLQGLFGPGGILSSTKSYALEFTEDAVTQAGEDYSCSVCYEIAKNAINYKCCEKLVCEKCTQTLVLRAFHQGDMSKCPCCMTPINSENLEPSKIREKLNLLHVKCPPCGITGQFSSMQEMHALCGRHIEYGMSEGLYIYFAKILERAECRKPLRGSLQSRLDGFFQYTSVAFELAATTTLALQAGSIVCQDKVFARCLQHEGYTHVVKNIMQAYHSSRDLQVAACEVLTYIVLNNEVGIEPNVPRNCALYETVMAAMKTFPTDIILQKYALGCLAMITHDAEISNLLDMTKQGMHLQVQQAALEFPDSQEIQHFALYVFHYIAKGSTLAKADLLSANVSAVIIKAMQRHPGDRRIMEDGKKALKLLGVKNVTSCASLSLTQRIFGKSPDPPPSYQRSVSSPTGTTSSSPRFSASNNFSPLQSISADHLVVTPTALPGVYNPAPHHSRWRSQSSFGSPETRANVIDGVIDGRRMGIMSHSSVSLPTNHTDSKL
eukprot:CFRG3705T1